MITPDEIKLRRAALRLNQRRLAELCEMSRTSLCRIETGKTKKIPVRIDSFLAIFERDEGALRFLMERRKVK